MKTVRQKEEEEEEDEERAIQKLWSFALDEV